MPNPKSKHTRMRRGMRRSSNSKIEAFQTTKCPQCGGPRMPHCVCKFCGFYNGELVVPKKVKKKKEGEEAVEKAEKEASEEGKK